MAQISQMPARGATDYGPTSTMNDQAELALTDNDVDPRLLLPTVTEM
jgi:hypothetical protein